MTSKTKPRASEFTQEELDKLATELGATNAEDVDFEHEVSDDGLTHTVRGTVNKARHEKRLADAKAVEEASAA